MGKYRILEVENDLGELRYVGQMLVDGVYVDATDDYNDRDIIVDILKSLMPEKTTTDSHTCPHDVC